MNSGEVYLVGTSSDNSYFASDLSTGNHYQFQVVAFNDAGEGPISGESDYIIAAEVPDQPTNLIRL